MVLHKQRSLLVVNTGLLMVMVDSYLSTGVTRPDRPGIDIEKEPPAVRTCRRCHTASYRGCITA